MDLKPPSFFKGLDSVLGLNPPTFDKGKEIDKPYVESAFPGKVTKILPLNWNQVYPYTFSIQGGVDPLANFSSRSVTLPIAPSSISISTQFASNVGALNRGVLEENNGVVFRIITISGTTGVWPTRVIAGKSQLKDSGTGTKIIANIFPGATSAISGVVKQAKKTASAFTGATKNKVEVDPTQTGYFQFWVLYNFLMAYAETKKTNKDIRLVFGMAKDNVGYICTPMNFDIKRDAANPLLYRYNIVLKSWGLVESAAQPITVFDKLLIPTPEDVNALKSVANLLKSSRATIQSARNVLQGVHSDLSNIMNIYTQGTLVVKEFAGLAEDIRDFPQIVQNNAAILLKGATNSMIRSLNSAFTGQPGQSVGKIPFTSVDEGQGRSSQSAGTKASIASAGATMATLGSRKTPGGEDIVEESSRLNIAKGALSDAVQNNDTFLDTQLNELDLPPTVFDEIEKEREKARNLTSGQVRELYSKLQEVSDNHAANVGMMDEQYAKLYGLPAPAISQKTPTEEDILIAVALQESKTAFTSTLATGQIFREREPDPFTSANAALQTNDQMDSPLSGVPVAFERGSTLERTAIKYLGDPNRAREIAILNGLRAPYIDEAGFELSIFNADGRVFVVKDVSNLAIWQQIQITGNGVAQTKRRILNIEDIGGGQWRVTADGPDNLSSFSPATSPKIKARPPGTIGSGDVILIPSGEISPDNYPVRPSSLATRLSHAEKVFKVDIALDESGKDFAVGPNGDVKRSAGYENAIQAIRLALEIERGEIEQHIEFGLPVPIGGRNSDITLDQLRKLVQDQIGVDPRFSGSQIGVTIEGSTVKVAIVAEGAKGTGTIPVEFEIGVSN